MADFLIPLLRFVPHIIPTRHQGEQSPDKKVLKINCTLATLIVSLLANPGLAQEPDSKQANESSAIAEKQIQKLKDNAKSFTLLLEHRGPQDKPFYHLLLSVPTLPDAKPNPSPFHQSAQMTEATAEKILDHLVADGFFNRAIESGRQPAPAPQKEPYYTLTLSVGGDLNTSYEERLGFDLKMLERLDGLRKLLDGDGAKGMDMLLTRMSGYRKLWMGESRSGVAEMITHLYAEDGKKRATSTQALLLRGDSVIVSLETVGAKQISPFGTIDTRRIDMVYSLIIGLQPNKVGAKAGYKSNGFGIKLEATATKADVVEMGKRHGFVLDGTFRADGHPNCYVKLAENQDLQTVLKAVLTEEPSVISVNLAYFEQ